MTTHRERWQHLVSLEPHLAVIAEEAERLRDGMDGMDGDWSAAWCGSWRDDDDFVPFKRRVSELVGWYRGRERCPFIDATGWGQYGVIVPPRDEWDDAETYLHSDDAYNLAVDEITRILES